MNTRKSCCFLLSVSRSIYHSFVTHLSSKVLNNFLNYVMLMKSGDKLAVKPSVFIKQLISNLNLLMSEYLTTLSVHGHVLLLNIGK